MLTIWAYSGFAWKPLARTALLGVVAAIAFLPVTASGQGEATAQQGIGFFGSPVVRRLDAVPQITAAEVRAHPPVQAPLTGAPPAEYAAKKVRAAKSFFGPVNGSMAPAKPQAAIFTPTATVSFTSTGEVACGNVTPADQAIAVGDTFVGVLQAINVCIDVYDKTGGPQAGYPKSLTSFVGLPANTPTSDPRAIYDWINQRYIVSFVQPGPNFATASQYWIAVSQADNPAGSYCMYNLPVQSVGASGGVFPLPDFPRLGQDRQAIYLASNIFNPNYVWEEILVLPKAQMYACQAISFPFFFNLTMGGVVTDTTQPANITNPGDDPRSEYLVTSKNIKFGLGSCSGGCNGLKVWTINSPLSSPTLTGVDVGTTNNYSLPPSASQPNSPNSIDSGDTRISGTVAYSAGSLYASVNTNGGQGQPAFILYQIQPFINQANSQINSARIANEIQVYIGHPQSFFYATQQPDPEGNVTTVFNFSDNSNYVGLAYVSRRAAQPVGTLPDSGMFAALGAGSYTQGRWGDYTAVAPAGLFSNSVPNPNPTMWFAGMFARSDHLWGTQIGRNGFTSISQP